MCDIKLRGGLPFIQVDLIHSTRNICIEHVLLDTGSGGTVFSADRLLDLGIRFERGDPVRRIRGVGGAEFVFSKRIDRIGLGDLEIDHFEIEVGAMDYGFDIEGILGMDFLLKVGAVVDLKALKLRHVMD